MERVDRSIDARESVFNTEQLMVSGRHTYSPGTVTSIKLLNILYAFFSLKYLRVVDEFTLFILFALHIEINTTALISNTFLFRIHSVSHVIWSTSYVWHKSWIFKSEGMNAEIKKHILAAIKRYCNEKKKKKLRK